MTIAANNTTATTHSASVPPTPSGAVCVKNLPVFVGDDAPLNLLVVLANANSQPGAQLAVIQGVHHAENLPLVEAQAVGRFLLILKVCPDVERVADIRLHDPPIHWPGESSGSEGAPILMSLAPCPPNLPSFFFWARIVTSSPLGRSRRKSTASSRMMFAKSTLFTCNVGTQGSSTPHSAGENSTPAVTVGSRDCKSLFRYTCLFPFQGLPG